MNFELQVDIPDLDEGQEVEIPLLGVFKNGTTTKLTVGQLQVFLQSTGQQLKDVNWPPGITFKAVKTEAKKEGGK